MSTKSLPLWRSLLYVPVTNPRFVEKSATSGADAIILDLEDSIAEAEKPRARTLLAAAAGQAASGGAAIVVRVNRPWRALIADLEAAVMAGIAALMLPKIESAEQVEAIAEIVTEMEAERGLAPGKIGLIPMIETARGFFRAEAIARADARNVALTLGAEDFALSLGMEPEAEGLFYPKQQMIIAARAAGIVPLGFIGTVADFSDLAALRATLRRSRRLGFLGASAIHPTQIAVINEEYSPSDAEIDRAGRLLAAYDAGIAAGKGAVAFEGRMIDAPVVARARQTLARAGAIAALAAKSG
ncbi:MAG: CoA ester lyase [Acidibrevibacterium sp.]|jgi:citrate lyase subunit beta/citryl-CoA lyase|uniref:HpcH/HpaI aldolase/citrate lyase family protein n=1 Tax=Acidibrevibacterium fodinaquatile TaxID=1969806 RepID=UPI0023A79959|nr:CoA ester lyase [Acidibrevibacterium fodinaquatile]MCA7120976.1 CoA ester lyase [Acidibrevibacterium fodinaquatile]